MADDRKILSDAELGLLTAIIGAVPTIGRWIGGLLSGEDTDPQATRRVRDVLPVKSASEQAADDIRAGRA